MNILEKICAENTFKSLDIYYTGIHDRSSCNTINDDLKYFLQSKSNKVIVLNDYFSHFEINGNTDIFENNLQFEFTTLSDFYNSTLTTSNYMEFIILPEIYNDVKQNMKEIFKIIYDVISFNLHNSYEKYEIEDYLSKLHNITDLNTFKIDKNIDFTKIILFDIIDNIMLEYKEDEESETENNTEVDIDVMNE